MREATGNSKKLYLFINRAVINAFPVGQTFGHADVALVLKDQISFLQEADYELAEWALEYTASGVTRLDHARGWSVAEMEYAGHLAKVSRGRFQIAYASIKELYATATDQELLKMYADAWKKREDDKPSDEEAANYQTLRVSLTELEMWSTVCKTLGQLRAGPNSSDEFIELVNQTKLLWSGTTIQIVDFT